MGLETLSQLFKFNVTQYNKPDLLIYRGHDGDFYNISSNEFKDRVVFFALGLKELGVKSYTKLILLSENRPEWHIIDFSCHLLNAVVVPIFPTLVAEQIEYIIQNSESELIVISTEAQAAKIHQIRNKIKKVKHIVAIEPEAVKREIINFESVLKNGSEQDDTKFLDEALNEAKPDVIATIIYTSGTTGLPKGVMLSHKNVVSNFLACSEVLEVGTSDRGLSFLPLSHAFERTVDYLYFYRGASIVYSKMEMVAQDLEESKPTIMAAVPRFYEKVKSQIEAKVEEEGGLKKKIFDWALKVGKEKAECSLMGKNGGIFLNIKYCLADQLVFSKIKALTGGNMKYFISGGAPLSPEVAYFFYSVGLIILEGYGLTETSPVITVNPPDKLKLETVGKALPGVEVKIADDGEILTRGPHVMMGYYKMPAETKEVLVEGWFPTGDIGQLDTEGYLSITDRKKQLLVTSVGKKVAPQSIEIEVENSKYIDQVVLIGEGRKFISALIVPNFEVLRNYAKEKHLVAYGNEALINNPAILELIQQEVDEHQMKFSDYEKIRKFRLLPKAFTIENGQLTPTLKVKRRIVEQEYADLIEEMYATYD
ncbi:MAG: AMP-dependent synthetase/ligase [bacterium]